jgi:hypothetical protein
MKKLAALFVLSALFLTSCGEPKTASSTSVDSSAATSSAAVSSPVASSENISSVTPVSSSEVPPVSSETTVKDWTADEKALISEHFGDVVDFIPYFDAVHTFTFDADYQCLTYASAITDSTATSTYKAALDALNYTTSLDEEGSLTAYGYYDDNGDLLHFDAYLIDNNGGFEIDIYQHIYTAPKSIRTVWNAAEIALFDQYFYSGASNAIPCYAPDDIVLSDSMESIQSLVFYSLNFGAKEVEAYGALLKEKSFAYDEKSGSYSLSVEGKGKITVDPFIDTYGDYYVTFAFAKEITGDLLWTGANFSGISYASTEATIDGVKLALSNVMPSTKNAAWIQMKKGVSYIANVEAVKPIATLTVDQNLEGKGFDGTLTVLAGISADQLTEITAVSGVYTLNNATFFKIEDLSAYACYIKSFTFAFAA